MEQIGIFITLTSYRRLLVSLSDSAIKWVIFDVHRAKNRSGSSFLESSPAAKAIIASRRQAGGKVEGHPAARYRIRILAGDQF